MENSKKENQESETKDQSKTVGDAKGKVSFDQNGEGDSPKYGQAGEDPSETKDGAKTGKL